MPDEDTGLGVRVVVLSHGVGLQLPGYQTPGSAGCDLRAALSAPRTLDRGERAVIPCGFAMALPVGTEAQVRPRSGLAVKHGVTVLNAPGTIDSDYRGEVMVPLINLGRDPFTIRRGDRIAQLVFGTVAQATFEVVEDLDDTERGDGGFGSTGQE